MTRIKTQVCLTSRQFMLIKEEGSFPGGSVVKNPPANAGDLGLIPGWGAKSPHVAEATQSGHYNY